MPFNYLIARHLKGSLYFAKQNEMSSHKIQICNFRNEAFLAWHLII